MKDKELLELAALAAGMDYGWQYAFEDYEGCTADAYNWNPLKDDGDAFRLAVKLSIELTYFDDLQTTNAGVWSEDSKTYDCTTPYDGDKQAATRRAIVRAAAGIGKSMKGQ